MLSNNGRISTIPHWHGAFTYQGVTHPYIMAGRNPRNGGTAVVGTQVIPINIVVDGCLDANGNPVAFNIDRATLNNTFNSPEFEFANFSTGYTQYTDAVQRAEFHSVMKQNWHTLLNAPNVLEPVTVEVPPEDSACLFFPPSGQPFADVDIDYFAGQLETVLELENVDPTQFSILLTKDIVLYEGGNIFNCCVIGFSFGRPSARSRGKPRADICLGVVVIARRRLWRRNRRYIALEPRNRRVGKRPLYEQHRAGVARA
jgi:hypothetical protein